MAKPRSDDVNIRTLARLGAETRLAEIKREESAILRTFPELRARMAEIARSPGTIVLKKRRPMSAAERKSVSERMKRYWAKRRKQKASSRASS